MNESNKNFLWEIVGAIIALVLFAAHPVAGLFAGIVLFGIIWHQNNKKHRSDKI